jgi:hypothetical protein
MRSTILLFAFLSFLNFASAQSEWKTWRSFDGKLKVIFPSEFSLEENDFQHLLLLKFPLKVKESKFRSIISFSKKSVGRFAKFEDCYNWRLLEIEEDGWKIFKNESVQYNKLKVYEIIYSKTLTVEMVKKEFLVLKNSELISVCFTSERNDFETNISILNKIFSRIKLK